MILLPLKFLAAEYIEVNEPGKAVCILYIPSTPVAYTNVPASDEYREKVYSALAVSPVTVSTHVEPL